MPVTCVPALVARMLRNLRSACREQDDNRRSLVVTQPRGGSPTGKIGWLPCGRPDPAWLRSEAAPSVRCGLAVCMGGSEHQRKLVRLFLVHQVAPLGVFQRDAGAHARGHHGSEDVTTLGR